MSSKNSRKKLTKKQNRKKKVLRNAPVQTDKERSISKIWNSMQDKNQMSMSRSSFKEFSILVMDLLDAGLSESDIVRVFSDDKGGAVLPAIPVDSPLSPDWLLEVAAQPILMAYSMNLPICQRQFQYGANTVSALHAAYLFNLVDHWRYVTNQIRAEGIDLKSIQDQKQASMQVPSMENQEVLFTWSNVDQGLLQFLGIPQFPSSIPLYESGYFTGTIINQYPEIAAPLLIGLTEEDIVSEFLEFYVEMITQLAAGRADQICRPDDYESPFLYDTTLWAINTPMAGTDSMANRLVNVRYYFPIPPSSEWLALSPAVDPSADADTNVRTRFTAYSGHLHYADRLRLGVYGRVSEIVEPGFLHVTELLDVLMKSLLLADIDLFEKYVTAIMTQDPNSPLLNLSRKELLQYFLVSLITTYSPYNAIMGYSLPPGYSTYAGFSYLPNPNYSSPYMFADFVEIMERHGYISHFRREKGRAWVNKCPVLVYDTVYPARIAPTDDLSNYGNIFEDVVLNWALKPGPAATIPLPGQTLCYTRGSFSQRIWNRLGNSLMQYGNVRLMSRFEDFKPYSDWDVFNLCFRNDSIINPVNGIDRHFIGYMRKFSQGERNERRSMWCQFFVLGLESLPALGKLLRVRTIEVVFGIVMTAYIDSTEDQTIEIENTLYFLDNDVVQGARRFKYQEYATGEQIQLYVTFHKGEGGNFWARVKNTAGTLLKEVGPIAASTIGSAIGGPAVGNLVGGITAGLLGGTRTLTKSKLAPIFMPEVVTKEDAARRLKRAEPKTQTEEDSPDRKSVV